MEWYIRKTAAIPQRMDFQGPRRYRDLEQFMEPQAAQPSMFNQARPAQGQPQQPQQRQQFQPKPPWYQSLDAKTKAIYDQYQAQGNQRGMEMIEQMNAGKAPRR